jgi:PIN domain nuclease of toxin-antitoxin system
MPGCRPRSWQRSASANDEPVARHPGLPLVHHNDPFDRLILGQAQLESLTLVTHDRTFEPYGVPILWV